VSTLDAEVVSLLVEPEQAGTRLDRYVAESLDVLSRSYAQQLIADGAILVNQQTCKVSQSLRAGDVVTVTIPPPQPVHIVPEAIPLSIVYEDKEIAIVDKPSGMVVHPAPGHSSGTLVHALLARYPHMQISGDIRPGIVHRIDQDTSGLLVVALNDHAMRILTEQQKQHQMHKAYLCVVEGRVKEAEGVIDVPIGRHPRDRKRQAVVAPAQGRMARTRYRVLEELKAYTLLEVTLETGRTHQIRVHMAYRHHPVLADPLYGPRKPRATFGLKRQFLHACRLGLYLPSDGTWREFCSPLPPDLATTLERLRQYAIS